MSFILHLGWELFQSLLFQDHGSKWQAFKARLFATATGDMLFMLIVYSSIASALQDLAWISDPKAIYHPAPWVLSVVIGFLLGLSFEVWAVHVDERWDDARMPILPILQVGITPLLQMVIVPVKTIVICAYLTKQLL